MKLIVMAVLVVLVALTIFLIMGVMFGCIMSLGCDTVSFASFIAGVLGLVLVIPSYFIYLMPQMVFGDLDWPMSVMIGIMAAIEIIYLYLLSCVVTIVIRKFRKKRKSEIIKNGIQKLHRHSGRRLTLILLISFAVIMLFDGLAFPRRLGYMMALFDDASFYIAKFSTAFSIVALSIFEIWYLIFLFLRRKKVVWNKFFLAAMWVIVFVLLALNIMMLVFGFL